MLVPIILATAVTVGALLYVAHPLLSRTESPPATRADGLAAGRLALVEERDRALAALKELEFDHRTGTISDEDYRSQVGPLRREAASTLQAIEQDGAGGSPSPPRRDVRSMGEPRS